METCKSIFEKLGPNKVTHPYTIHKEYEEGFFESSKAVDRNIFPLISNIAERIKRASTGSSSSSASCTDCTEQLQTSQLPLLYNSPLESLMLWKIPSISLLPKERRLEELKRFKDDLLKSIQCFDLKKLKGVEIDIQNAKESIEYDKYTYDLFEFLGILWDTTFIIDSPIKICGKYDHLSTKKAVYIDSKSYDMLEDVEIEDYRKQAITKEVVQKLKTVKEYRDLLQSVKIPVTTIDKETNKKRLLLKAELIDITLAYI